MYFTFSLLKHSECSDKHKYVVNAEGAWFQSCISIVLNSRFYFSYGVDLASS